MKIEDLGDVDSFREAIEKLQLEDFEPGRVTAEHRERYVVRSSSGEYEAEITGNLRFSAQSRADFPAVGDWVALMPYNAGQAIIHQVLPRYSVITRRAAGKQGEEQIVAANIDYALLVQAIDRDFNPNRLERYLTICYASKVSPLIILTKIDLVSPELLSKITESLQRRIGNIPVLPLSNETGEGLDSLQKSLLKGKTYCLLGSPGAGKSSLTNRLAGDRLMQTGTTSESTNKGRHITSHRELIVLPNGAILIDNPGMREVGVGDASAGLEDTFDQIIRLAGECRFSDCTHTKERGCAVLEALELGELDEKSYANFMKIQKKAEHFGQTVSEKRQKDKAFGKMIRNFKEDMNKLSEKHKNQ